MELLFMRKTEELSKVIIIKVNKYMELVNILVRYILDIFKKVNLKDKD